MAEGSSYSTSDLESLTKSDTFLEWFWKGTNGNNVIKELNSYAQKNHLSDRIRREKSSPFVYALVANNFLEKQLQEQKVSGRSKKVIQWKLVKVGLTHESVQEGVNNRMEQLKRQVDSKLNSEAAASKVDTSILFVLRIGAVDTGRFQDTEARIRGKVGTPVTKGKAKALNLPVPTEWVLTTQEHINAIKDRIKDEAKSKDSENVIDVFKSIKTPPNLPEEFQEWVKEEIEKKKGGKVEKEGKAKKEEKVKKK